MSYYTGYGPIDDIIAGNLKLASLSDRNTNKARQEDVKDKINTLRRTLLDRVEEAKTKGAVRSNRIIQTSAGNARGNSHAAFTSVSVPAEDPSLLTTPSDHPRKTRVQAQYGVARKNFKNSTVTAKALKSEERKFLIKLNQILTGYDHLPRDIPESEIQKILYAELGRVAKWRDVFSTLPKLGLTNWFTTYLPTLLELPFRFLADLPTQTIKTFNASFKGAFRYATKRRGGTIWGAVFLLAAAIGYLVAGFYWVATRFLRSCADAFAHLRYTLVAFFNAAPKDFIKYALSTAITVFGIVAIVAFCIPIFGQLAAGGTVTAIGLLKMLAFILGITTVTKGISNVLEYGHCRYCCGTKGITQCGAGAAESPQPEWVKWTSGSHTIPANSPHSPHGRQDETKGHNANQTQSPPPGSNAADRLGALPPCPTTHPSAAAPSLYDARASAAMQPMPPVLPYSPFAAAAPQPTTYSSHVASQMQPPTSNPYHIPNMPPYGNYAYMPMAQPQPSGLAFGYGGAQPPLYGMMPTYPALPPQPSQAAQMQQFGMHSHGYQQQPLHDTAPAPFAPPNNSAVPTAHAQQSTAPSAPYFGPSPHYFVPPG